MLTKWTIFQVLYIYESIAGYGLIILRTIGWCMFIYSTFFTLKHYPDKGGFYYPYFSFYTLWFVAGPCIIIIANHIIAEWVRQKVSYTLLFSMIIRDFFMNVCISYQLLLCESLFSALFLFNGMHLRSITKQNVKWLQWKI